MVGQGSAPSHATKKIGFQQSNRVSEPERQRGTTPLAGARARMCGANSVLAEPTSLGLIQRCLEFEQLNLRVQAGELDPGAHGPRDLARHRAVEDDAEE